MGARATVKCACGRCRSRGREERAPRSLENHTVVFHSDHKASSSTLNRGHFYCVKNGDISISL